MHFVTFLSLAILQVLAVMHAVSRGLGLQYILMICLFPVAGPIAHFIIDIYPRLRFIFANHKTKLKQIVNKKMNPIEQLEALKKAALNTPNYENGYQLVLGLLAKGCEADAYSQIQTLRKGIFADCPRLIYLQAKIELKLGLNLDAFETIKPLVQANDTLPEFDILFARVLEANHYHSAAVEEYRKLLNKNYSFEAHFYYIQLLTKLEHNRQVKREIMCLVDRYKQLDKSSKRQHKKWATMANELH